MKSFFLRLKSDTGASSAAEFALALPLMLLALIGVADLGNALFQRNDMESALRSGAQYFMNGGSDVSSAVGVVDAAWTSRPEGAVVTSERYCLCGTVVSVCTQLCADNSYPIAYQRLVASVTLQGLLSESSYEASQIVRVR
jgi:Flp pilus assembly protein TadG